MEDVVVVAGTGGGVVTVGDGVRDLMGEAVGFVVTGLLVVEAVTHGIVMAE